MTTRRLTVQGAADALGVSANAVRMRVRRGSLHSERDEEGRVWVLVGPDEEAGVYDQHETDQPTFELIEQLRSENAYLREVVATRDEEIRRRDHIIMSALERVPELEAGPTGQDQRSPSKEPAHSDAQGSPDPDPRKADAEPSAGAQRRSWWRRIFGG